jgi:hypothetical protein
MALTLANSVYFTRFKDLPTFPVSRTRHKNLIRGGNMEFVMFEDVDGMEVYVNPERVIWVRELPNQTTVISCGHDDKFAVRLHPAQALAVLGKSAHLGS